jgi:hypothetical protein
MLQRWLKLSWLVEPLILNPSPTQRTACCGEKDFGEVVVQLFLME